MSTDKPFGEEHAIATKESALLASQKAFYSMVSNEGKLPQNVTVPSKSRKALAPIDVNTDNPFLK